jgi:DNA-binding IclR family transcriptional regulator
MKASHAADMIALLYKAPRTVAEVVELTGITTNTVRGWMLALASEGLLVRVGERRDKGVRGAPAVLYGWRKPL